MVRARESRQERTHKASSAVSKTSPELNNGLHDDRADLRICSEESSGPIIEKIKSGSGVRAQSACGNFIRSS